MIRSSVQPTPSDVAKEPALTTRALVGLLKPPPTALLPASHAAVAICSPSGPTLNGTLLVVTRLAAVLAGPRRLPMPAGRPAGPPGS